VVDYDPGTEAPLQVFPLQDLPSQATPVTAAWLNHVDAILEDIAGADGRIADIEDGGGAGAVDSVNGATGVVVLDADDLGDGASNVMMTVAERAVVEDAVTSTTINEIVSITQAAYDLLSPPDPAILYVITS
jgi:hypothetical protein